MTYSKINSSAATGTKNLYGDEISPFSGMCAICIEGCNGLCEIGKSSYRGSEAIYPQPFGKVTAASQKDYPIDYSHFNIMGSASGAKGVEEDSDKAIFTNVNLETCIGKNKSLRLKLPFIIAGLGSTDIARNNWEGLAIGSAISGVILTIGENVCGIDPRSEFDNKGKVVKSPELERRVNLYKEWQQDGYGGIVVQANVEDTRFGVLEYAIEKLGVEIVELKWGQGAKDIGGEIKINNLERAIEIKKRGYIVLPDPLDPDVQRAFHHGDFKEFERHSRIGMVNREDFLKSVEHLRKVGAKYIFLKTGAYRPSDLAKAIKYSSEAGIDLITIDGAGGGTGMSPWRMMNEWGIPTVYLQCLAYNYAKFLDEKGKYVPDMAIAGGFTLEDLIFKGLALGAPYFKAVAMARSPITACMVGKTLSEKIKNNDIPQAVKKYGSDIESIFVEATDLMKEFKEKFNNIPGSAIGLFSYFKRLEQGLKQLMCGARKFALNYIERSDLVALTKEASEISGIPYVMELDREEAKAILEEN
ncbi:MAG: FMN-binding glutamate synthase family protein [Actinobacteria bacterium]|nr:FMN-binding glutamate synthase family protein [Actinomycetota bacterium]